MSDPVLVVDDDPSILALVSELLSEEGYGVMTATNGREALDVAKEQPLGLVLLDMRMPVMDGWAFARLLRSSGKIVPIVVMTAATDAARWAKEIGADAYVAKPFDIGGLLDTVAEHIRPDKNKIRTSSELDQN